MKSKIEKLAKEFVMKDYYNKTRLWKHLYNPNYKYRETNALEIGHKGLLIYRLKWNEIENKVRKRFFGEKLIKE